MQEVFGRLATPGHVLPRRHPRCSRASAMELLQSAWLAEAVSRRNFSIGDAHATAKQER